MASDVERPDQRAVVDRALERLELAVAEDIGHLDDLVAETRVRLVDAVAIHGLLVGQARERSRDVHTAGGLEHGLQQALEEGVDLFFRGEATSRCPPA